MRTVINIGKTLVLLGVVTGFVLLISVAIWPGQLSLTGALFCPDDQPDAAVVTTTGEVIIQPAGQGPRTVQGSTPSLVCRGDSGPPTVVGTLRPALALGVGYAVIISLVTIAIVFRPSELRRVAAEMAAEDAASGPGPGSTAGPFVD